ncbi:efflux RND transporter periplasmic adaptor subunit [Faecalibacter rhinopitheci]|uniref:Efflux RND transporter periplasmic adaptor subunit n=1 Tax=Faecalibacter rhinopitheci TaxID=2779678 RepID=A0A8J7K3K4_9FLAO|nr:efflux RND transporter periplasmic adaptor subunit [Faecalibacter rhinopitheci]MBF0596284.1 efflux RND transporter periplasmic adaptor subunit [Faecalibacter rhinopitheci]MBQ0148654.1 efflux RND transporter periplasmic adaptor subunit [Candidatus Onthonaster equi]
MKKVLKIVAIVVFIALVVGVIGYFGKKNSQDNQVYEITQPFMGNLEVKAVATGEVKPVETIEIKPNISGVIKSINVSEGQYVEKGQLIAEIKVVPNVASLNQAAQNIRSAEIQVNLQQKDYNRANTLYKQGVIPKSDYDNALAMYQSAQQTLRAAQTDYKVAQTGVAPGLEAYATTRITATTSGVVLDIPVEVGNMVQEINNFSTGTTIATMADITKMIFQGKVDESEVGKLKEGMKINVSIGAIPNKTFTAILDFISPQGVANNGVVQFDIKAPIQLDSQNFIRAGYSANAEVITSGVQNVLLVKSAHIRYDENQKPYVDVLKSGSGQDAVYEKKYLTLGITDGVNVEVKKGITKDDKIKIWNTDLEKPNGPGPH